MNDGPDDPRLARDLAGLALRTAREAAALVDEHRHGARVADTKSSATDPVTAVDRASEALVRDRLLSARPDDAVLGEEGDDVAGTSGVRWVIDPIDGTVNFLYGLPQYAVSIAAQVADGRGDHRTVAGVVLHVGPGTEYLAAPDEGGTLRATADGRPLAVRRTVPLAERLLATGFSYDPDLRRRQAQALVGLLPRVRDVRRLGSSALDVCLVAAGVLDGYVEEGVHLWDYAASTLVAQAAGARVRTTTGTGGRTLLVVAPAAGFDALWTAVHDAGFGAAVTGE